MFVQPAVFAPVLAFSLLFFLWSCWRRFGLVTIGSSEDRFSRPAVRLREMLIQAFGQKRVTSRPFGLNHAIIFWSFLLLLAANGEFLLRGVFPALALEALPPAFYRLLLLLFDVASLAALAAALIAVVRRLARPPYPEARTAEAFIILGMIVTLMLAYFGLRGVEIELRLTAETAFMPISSRFAAALSGLSPEQLQAAGQVFWWIHAIVLLGFMNFLPYSKHMHILTAIPNCFFRRLEKPNTLPREEFAPGKSFGVERVDRFSWKDLFDSLSCTECGRCQNACPAHLTGKPLNPRQVIHDLKLNLLENGPRLRRGQDPATPLIGAQEGSVAPEAIWSCTTCGACMSSCPVFIEQMPKLIELRRYLVETKAEFPEELISLFENMENRSNPWGLAPAERGKWASLLDVKPFEAGKTEYLFYVGCAGSFDSRSKQVTVALASLLDAAGVSWGILGKDEKCCGDSLRRLGNEFVFDRMARENAGLFASRGVKKVIVQCPHCFSTLKNDYRQYGVELEVVHHAELLQRLLEEKKLELPPQRADGKKTLLHDSCYLGRHNDVYQAPRAVFAAATGSLPGEFRRNRENAFCCGAGGGRMWMEENLGTRINLARMEEALESAPDTLCVSCPYCMTMFEDGLKDLQAGQIQVRDIAEIVAERLFRKTGAGEGAAAAGK